MTTTFAPADLKGGVLSCMPAQNPATVTVGYKCLNVKPQCHLVSHLASLCVHPYRHIHRLHQLFTELLHLKCIHIQRVMVLYYKHHMVKKGNMTPAVEKETETFLESVLALRIKCSEVLRSSKLSI